MEKRLVVCMVVLGLIAFCVGQGIAAPTPVSVKFTTNALGLGTADINYDGDGNPVDPDIAGKFITSPTTGQGSFLYVQNSGAAGMGTGSDPLLVTITAKSHQDTVGAPPDWYAGILTITAEDNTTPDGALEGLGVRCFSVNPATGLRVIDPTTHRARIEGSKEISGGTANDTWGVGGYPDFNGTKNGPPHVDEIVIFDFAKPMVANTVVTRLSKLTTTDVVDLSINIKRGGSTLVLSDHYLTTSEAPLVHVTGGSNSEVYDLVFANMPGLQAGDEVTSFQVRAIDPYAGDPSKEKGTAEHFLISGIKGSIDELASVGDFVWHDLNANGIQDAGEPCISGVTVNLLNSSSAVIGTTTTNASGSYSFSSLSPGGYYVEFVKPASYNKFSPQDQGVNDAVDSDASTSTGKTALITLTSGQSDMTRDAGMFQYASVGDYVWNDLNANGIQDAGEPGISGATVNLLNTSNAVIATTTTNASGLYSFTGLTPGSYKVEFVKPASYNKFSPQDQGVNDAVDSDASTSDGKTASFTLTSGQSDMTRDAGMFQYASLGDFVWNDLNGNGIQDAGEPGVEDVSVNLLDASNAVIATTATNASGLYSFTGLTPGSYKVEFVLPAGYDGFTLLNVGSDLLDSDADLTTGRTSLMTLISGQNDMTWDAGLLQSGGGGNVPEPATLGMVGIAALVAMRRKRS